jgi:protein-tyrosine phosphatase
VTQQTPEAPSAEPELTGVRNFRDLGGLPAADGRRVRHGVLFRSGHLAAATAEDAAFLASLGLHTVFDFRNAEDIAVDGPDIALPGVRHVNLPLSNPAQGARLWAAAREGDLAVLRELLGDGRAASRMTRSYRSHLRTRTAEHRRLLTDLAEDSVPALLHCAAGKDRAGLAVAVTLLALGVERDAVATDYLRSAAAHRRYRMRRTGIAEEASAEIDELLDPLLDARIEYLAAAFDAVEETWGSFERYFADGLGLTAAQRERLRDRLLTG